MYEFVRSTVEYQNWGWNAVVVGSFGAIIFTFIEGWGLWKQNQAIWRGKSGESVSVSWFSYFLFALAAFFFYGIHIHGIAAMFNGVALTLVHIPILLGLWKYKGFAKWEKVQFFCLALMVPAMAFLPWKNEVFTIVSVGIIYSLATQPLELWKTKKTGAVEIKLLVVYTLSTAFWVIYAFAINEWVLEILTSVNLFLLGLATLLWFKYRAREPVRAAVTP